MTTSAPDTAPDYADTAYRSNRQPPELPEASQQSALFRKSWTMGPPLSTGQLSHIYPSGFLTTWTPKRLREYQAIETEKGVTELEERHTHYGRLDEEMLRYATLPKTSWLLLWMRHGGRVVFLMLLPVFIWTMISGWNHMDSDVTFVEFFWESIIPFFNFLLLPLLLCWGVGLFVEKAFPKVVYKTHPGQFFR